MSVQLIPAFPPELRHGRFSFSPPIVGTKQNEWTLRRATWTEFLVANTETLEEVWIPRRFWGEVVSDSTSLPKVTLLKELEFKAGSVRPYRRGVIEMPQFMNRPARPETRIIGDGHPAPVIMIRTDSVTESRMGRILRSSVAVGILGCVGVLFLVPHFSTLTGRDDYASVVKKLGTPSKDQWIPETGGIGYRNLWYPQKKLTVILAGKTPQSAHYTRTLKGDGDVSRATAPGMPGQPTPVLIH